MDASNCDVDHEWFARPDDESEGGSQSPGIGLRVAVRKQRPLV